MRLLEVDTEGLMTCAHIMENRATAWSKYTHPRGLELYEDQEETREVGTPKVHPGYHAPSDPP